MSSDVADIEKVLQVYFDGLYEGDTRKLGQAFHPSSHLYSVGADGKAADFPRADWFKMVESRKSAKASGSTGSTISSSSRFTRSARSSCDIRWSNSADSLGGISLTRWAWRSWSR